MKIFLRYHLPLLLGVALFSTGCVSNKYKAASALDAQPQPLNIDLGGGPVKSRLDAIVLFQGPGSWKKSAYWDEFTMTFTNEGNEPVTLTSADLVDYAGALGPAGTDPWLLEKASLAQRDRYTRAGVSFVLNTLGYAAFTYGAVGAGVMAGATVTNTWSGVAAGATVGLVAVPVTAIAIYANNQKHRHALEREFNRRRLPLPLTLAPGESRAGSFFFPMTAGPQSLRIGWTRAAASDHSFLPLPMLAGLHLKGPNVPEAGKP